MSERPLARGARMRQLPLASLVAAMVLLASSTAWAHPLSFGVMELRERPDRSFDLVLRFSGDEDAPSAGAPRIHADCRLEDAIDVPLDFGVQVRGRLRCDGGLVGKEIGVEGLVGTGIQVPLSIIMADGDVQTTVLTGDAPLYRVRPRSSAADVLRDYGLLGVEHIALGFDHLLLVLGLLLATRGPKQLVATITAFTLGHSLTLALASLGVLSVPSPPVEACIALSLVLLAADLVRRNEAEAREGAVPVRRSPTWLVAVVFGLLHGLGFAGALSEVGLHEHALSQALVGFNLGVELGQLLFVAMLLVIGALGRRLLAAELRARWLGHVPVALGALATYFLLERITTLGS